MNRFLLALLFAISCATGVVLRAQQPHRPDPMTQRLATCVDVLSGVASGQLADRAQLLAAFKAAFEQANPGQSLGPDMKVIEKKGDKAK